MKDIVINNRGMGTSVTLAPAVEVFSDGTEVLIASYNKVLKRFVKK